MSKQLRDEVNYDRLRNVHMNKYQAINTKVKETYEDQKHLLNKMNHYNSCTDFKREIVLENKNKQFIMLDTEVRKMKQDEIDIEKTIEKIQNLGIAEKHKFKDIDFKNDRLEMDFKQKRYINI